MDRYFTKTFVRFFVAFLVILGMAFGVIILASSEVPAPTEPVDNVALPQ